MNPTFRHIDWSACAPAITRLDAVTVRVWAKSVSGPHWTQLLDLPLALHSLHYLGKSVSIPHCYPCCYPCPPR